jgi:hypothetical protein
MMKTKHPEEEEHGKEKTRRGEGAEGPLEEVGAIPQ